MAASLAAPDPYGRLSRIRLPPWMLDGEALVRPGVEEARFGEPMIGELPDPLPGHAVLLAAPPERAPPEVHDVVSERCDGSHVGRDGVVVEEAGDHLLEPCALLADRPVHPPPQLRLHFLELRPHAVAPALPLDLELAGAGLAADAGESEEGEGLRFALSALFTVRRRKAAVDQAGLVRMERQRERLEPRSHRIEEPPCVGLPLEARDRRCHVAMRKARAGCVLRIFQAAATASRHVVIAAARSTRRESSSQRTPPSTILSTPNAISCQLNPTLGESFRTDHCSGIAQAPSQTAFDLAS